MVKERKADRGGVNRFIGADDDAEFLVAGDDGEHIEIEDEDGDSGDLEDDDLEVEAAYSEMSTMTDDEVDGIMAELENEEED